MEINILDNFFLNIVPYLVHRRRWTKIQKFGVHMEIDFLVIQKMFQVTLIKWDQVSYLSHLT